MTNLPAHYRPGLDVVRLGAVLPVLCYHFCIEAAGRGFAVPVQLIGRGMADWVEVGLAWFFLLSGAALCLQWRGRFAWRPYLAGRAAAMYPPFWLGFFALFFTTFGLLTRAFIETIDEVSANCIEALRASGANFIQTVFQGIFPSVITGLITWILYMIETNIRSSTLIGILTATGIGYLFDMYYKRLDFSSASLVVVLIIVMVVLIEMISNQIRKGIF